MGAQASGQDGHCGNFNRDASDDSVDLIRARMELKVPDQELLFPKPNPLAGDAEPKVRELSMCTPDVRAKAEALCKGSLGTHALGQVLEACVFDRCFGGGLRGLELSTRGTNVASEVAKPSPSFDELGVAVHVACFEC